jgi:DNA polymerase-3 subunit alpha (Gram-positive type)
MNKFIVFDIETTGLYAEMGDRILEIGAIPIVDDEIVSTDTFERLVNPGIDIPPDITAINRITNEMVRDAASIEDVLPEFLEYVDDYPLIAHNASFDVGFVNYFSERLVGRIIQNRVIDTIEISKRIFSQHRFHNLDSMLKRLGISYRRNERHRS